MLITAGRLWNRKIHKGQSEKMLWKVALEAILRDSNTFREEEKKFQKQTNEMVVNWIMKSYPKLGEDTIKKTFVRTGIVSKEEQKEITEVKCNQHFIPKKDQECLYNGDESESEQEQRYYSRNNEIFSQKF
eukprot:TRINITY_DN32238_c0_g2_i1.p2 TRINITY_DN32238_c0_g2~~TRINITY_DN32238_c0_g2_i1.p2  ORF type:complete len:131 (+),score=6.68 TRINITY_DN32238_c0_g2_i1:324-716(+)